MSVLSFALRPARSAHSGPAWRSRRQPPATYLGSYRHLPGAITVEATAPVTVEQAAAVLGVSVSTVHRRIRSGVLKAEQAARPQGKVWLVHLPPDVVVATGQPSPPIASEATAPTAPI